MSAGNGSERADVVVVGAGAAGLAAALSLTRRGHRTRIIERQSPGGEMAAVGLVEDLPIFTDRPTGPIVAARLTDAARSAGVSFSWGDVQKIERAGNEWVVSTEEEEMCGRAVVVATGGQHRPLGIPGEAGLRGKGVSDCATCDGPLFAGRRVVVAGAGRWTRAEAATLAAVTGEVIVLAEDLQYLQESAAEALGKAATIEWRIGERPIQIIGDAAVTAVVSESRDGRRREIPCDALFVCADREPGTALVGSALNQIASAGGDNPHRSRARTGLFLAGEVRTGSSTIAMCLAEGAAVSEQVTAVLNRELAPTPADVVT